MGKKDLKKQYPDLDVSVIDYVSRIDPSKTNKLTPFLLKIISKQNLDKKHLVRTEWSNIANNRIDRYIFTMLMDMVGEGVQGLQTLKEFNEHLENNRIENSDISKYETWEDLLTQKGLADIKLMDKESTKQVDRIYEDTTWLVVKPLSFNASLTYGSGTKWCTAMKREPHYFYKYTTEGILIYTINKTNGKKFGIFSSPNEVSFWNNVDNRIDSIESGIPYEILSLIRESLDLDNNKKNFELFSDKERENKRRYYDGEKKMYNAEEPIPLMAEVAVEYDYQTEEMMVYEEDRPDLVMETASYNNHDMGGVAIENYLRIVRNDVQQG